MRFAIVGCGFVADYYLKTLPLHPGLKIRGVFDSNPDRAKNFSAFHSVPSYASLDELLDDKETDIVVNLTNPASHFQVSHASLKSGKHVYSEKPLAMTLTDAIKLVELAEKMGLQLSSAPCSLLGETAQTIWKAIRKNAVGKVRLVYAEMDDGMIHKMPYRKWFSDSNIPWPYKDEFETGCTIEHAGYYLTWLAAFFGPAKTVTAFSSTLIQDKQTDVRLDIISSDFSVACIEFASGVTARLTCSIVAPHDHSLNIIGDDGIIYTKDCWYYRSPVYIKRRITIRRRTFISPIKKKYPMVKRITPKFSYKGAQQMDFCRGVAELADSVKGQRPCHLSARFSLHVNELSLAIHHARKNKTQYNLTTTFEPINPVPWSED